MGALVGFSWDPGCHDPEIPNWSRPLLLASPVVPNKSDRHLTPVGVLNVQSILQFETDEPAYYEMSWR